MNFFKKIFVLTTLLFSFQSVAEEKNSFRSILLDDSRNQKMVEILGGSCVLSLQSIWISGNNLEHPLIKNKTVKMKDLTFPSGVQDNTFYHLTAHPGLKNLFQLDSLDAATATKTANDENRYEQMLDYLRTKSNETLKHYPMWYRSFYLSEDPESVYIFYYSLKNLYQLEFTIDMNANVYLWNEIDLNQALKDLGDKFPTLKENCHLNQMIIVNDVYSKIPYNPLYFIMLDENDVDFSDYKQNNHWFQAIKTRSFNSVRLTEKFLKKNESTNPYIRYHSAPSEIPSQTQKTLESNLSTQTKISILSAQYGSIDVTKKVSDYCNSKPNCNYKLAHRYVFDDASKSFTGDFIVTYACIYSSNGNETYKTMPPIYFSSPAENNIVNLKCEP